MKKQFLLFGLIIILFSACTRNTVDTTSQAAIDDARIQAYLTANHISATKGPQGIYYKILIPDTSTQHPTTASTVQVSYTGKFLNGSQFDQETAQFFSLTVNPSGGVIAGWQIGIPIMATGERMLLIVPSGLGYGATTQGSIPANSVLVFTIDLLGFY